MDDRTIVKISQLPQGQDYAWHPDINLVELADGLDEAGRQHALAQLQDSWLQEVLGELAAA